MIQSIDVSAVLRRTRQSAYVDLVTRATGRAVREEIERAVAGDALPVARMDFSGVRIIDFSCADEIVAKLLRERLRVLLVRGISDGHLEALVPVLEGHGLAVVLEREDGTLEALGSRDSAAALFEELVALRLATLAPGGTLTLVAA